jgi:hypothetical protein
VWLLVELQKRLHPKVPVTALIAALGSELEGKEVGLVSWIVGGSHVERERQRLMPVAYSITNRETLRRRYNTARALLRKDPHLREWWNAVLDELLATVK